MDLHARQVQELFCSSFSAGGISWNFRLDHKTVVQLQQKMSQYIKLWNKSARNTHSPEQFWRSVEHTYEHGNQSIRAVFTIIWFTRYKNSFNHLWVLNIICASNEYPAIVEFLVRVPTNISQLLIGVLQSLPYLKTDVIVVWPSANEYSLS